MDILWTQTKGSLVATAERVDGTKAKLTIMDGETTISEDTFTLKLGSNKGIALENVLEWQQKLDQA